MFTRVKGRKRVIRHITPDVPTEQWFTTKKNKGGHFILNRYKAESEITETFESEEIPQDVSDAIDWAIAEHLEEYPLDKPCPDDTDDSEERSTDLLDAMKKAVQQQFDNQKDKLIASSDAKKKELEKDLPVQKLASDIWESCEKYFCKFPRLKPVE